ncbi:hypothetical protein ABXV18_26895 [Vibrio owensii]|uniref:hypothetical protein n=1 Tax=Vibrio owensii TaxID=696485 RepID=UPI0033907E47
MNSITCPLCKRESFSQKDIDQKFCGVCGYHSDLAAWKKIGVVDFEPIDRKSCRVRALGLSATLKIDKAKVIPMDDGFMIRDGETWVFFENKHQLAEFQKLYDLPLAQ